MTNQEAVLKGREAAERESVVGWGVFGICLPLIAVIVALCRTPPVSADAVASHNDEKTQWFFTTEYVRTLKSRQVQIALLGAVIGFVAALILIAGFVVLVGMTGLAEITP